MMKEAKLIEGWILIDVVNFLVTINLMMWNSQHKFTVNDVHGCVSLSPAQCRTLS